VTLTAREFIAKWQAGAPAAALNERAGAQAHFIDLCRLLGVPEPGDPQAYCFERGVTRTGSERARIDGFADVWLKGHFAWEYKAPGKSLEGALRQPRAAGSHRVPRRVDDLGPRAAPRSG